MNPANQDLRLIAGEGWLPQAKGEGIYGARKVVEALNQAEVRSLSHEANKRLSKLFVRALLPSPRAVMAEAIDQDGNNPAASTAPAIEQLLGDDRVESGDLRLLLCFGLGMSWVAQVDPLPGRIPRIRPPAGQRSSPHNLRHRLQVV